MVAGSRRKNGRDYQSFEARNTAYSLVFSTEIAAEPIRYPAVRFLGVSRGAMKPEIDRATDRDTTSEVGTVAVPLTDLTPDDRNANAGTERGRAMVEESLRRFGAARAIVADRNLKIIAGNTAHEAAIDIGLTDALIVKTDGTKLVVVQRTDLDLDSPAGRALAIADNRSSEVGLSWDPGVLAELAAYEAVDLSLLFSDVELASLLGSDAPVPKFSPEPAPYRLDELARAATTCPRCGHQFKQE